MKNTYRLSTIKSYLFSIFVLAGTLQTFKLHAEIPVGSSSFVIPFMGNDITVDVFKPSTYVDQPLIIVIPGVVRSATNARNDAIGLACKCSCIVASPHLSNEHFPTAADYDHGGVFPNEAYDPLTGALFQLTQPKPQNEWSLNAVLSVFHHIRTEENNPTLKYYLFGDGAGGQYINAFGLFLYPLLPDSEKPVRMAIANLGTATFPGYPIMKEDAIHVNRSQCYTGPNRELTVRHKVKQGYPDYCTTTAVQINCHYNYPENPEIFQDRYRFRKASRRQLPYPFGLGNIDPMPNLNQYLEAPLVLCQQEIQKFLNKLDRSLVSSEFELKLLYLLRFHAQ